MTPTMEKERVKLALAKAQRQFPLEPKVVGMGHELIVDSTGDDAVDVAVKIDEEAPEDQWTPERLEPIVKAIRNSFRQDGIELWPYVHFFTPSEEQEAKAEAEEADRKKSALDAEQDGPR